MKKVLSLLLSVLFFLGWGIFYCVELNALSRSIITGCLPPDKLNIDIYIWTVAQVSFALLTGLFVKSSWKNVLYGDIKRKLKILLYSFICFLLWLLLCFSIIVVCEVWGFYSTDCFFRWH